VQPSAEALHLLRHDGFGADELAFYLRRIRARDLAEVVDVVQVAALEVADPRIEVAGDGDVDQE